MCGCVNDWALLFRAQLAHINLYANGACKLFKIHMPRPQPLTPCPPCPQASAVKRRKNKK